METIATKHWHIDNGGIEVSVHQDPKNTENLEIEFTTQYFGYPSVSSKLSIWGELGRVDADMFLQQLATVFLRASAKLQDAKKDEQCGS